MLICLMLLNLLNKPNISNMERTPPGSSKNQHICEAFLSIHDFSSNCRIVKSPHCNILVYINFSLKNVTI